MHCRCRGWLVGHPTSRSHPVEDVEGCYVYRRDYYTSTPLPRLLHPRRAHRVNGGRARLVVLIGGRGTVRLVLVTAGGTRGRCSVSL